jgi:hypothetical protein
MILADESDTRKEAGKYIPPHLRRKSELTIGDNDDHVLASFKVRKNYKTPPIYKNPTVNIEPYINHW